MALAVVTVNKARIEEEILLAEESITKAKHEGEKLLEEKAKYEEESRNNDVMEKEVAIEAEMFVELVNEIEEKSTNIHPLDSSVEKELFVKKEAPVITMQPKSSLNGHDQNEATNSAIMKALNAAEETVANIEEVLSRKQETETVRVSVGDSNENVSNALLDSKNKQPILQKLLDCFSCNVL